MKKHPVRTLIFDLGGVILDLSVDSTIREFALLAGISGERAKEIFKSSPEFNLYEKGEMNDNDFRKFLQLTYAPQAPLTEIDRAWNAMLIDIPKIKLDLLEALKRDYQVFLLSNTNDIHLEYINNVILKRVTGRTNLDEYFHKAYYSHRMLKRKPDAEIYEHVVRENGLLPQETLFLDDNLSNVEGAKSVGLKTVHVTHPDLILEYFHE